MAVQTTHYPSSNTFSSGIGIVMKSNNIWEELHHQNINHSQAAGHRNLAQMLNVTVFSEPESELTCNNASGGRKRNRDHLVTAGDALKTQQLYHHHHLHHNATASIPQYFPDPGTDSGPASTSGRSPEMGSFLCNNRDLELEALIRFQNQKLRAMVEETRKKQSRSLLSMIERQTVMKLQEKETELEKANRANMELEERVKQMSAENQMWFNVAKNSEATISSLRLSLEQILIQTAGNQVAAEGFGETDGGDEAQSGGDEAEMRSRENVKLRRRKSCKGCGGGDAAVLVLPCRHLCLCIECENRVYCCPVCNAVKNSTLQVFMS